MTRENHCRWLMLPDDILSLGVGESLWFAKLGYYNDFSLIEGCLVGSVVIEEPKNSTRES